MSNLLRHKSILWVLNEFIKLVTKIWAMLDCDFCFHICHFNDYWIWCHVIYLITEENIFCHDRVMERNNHWIIYFLSWWNYEDNCQGLSYINFEVGYEIHNNHGIFYIQLLFVIFTIFSCSNISIQEASCLYSKQPPEQQLTNLIHKHGRNDISLIYKAQVNKKRGLLILALLVFLCRVCSSICIDSRWRIAVQ